MSMFNNSRYSTQNHFNGNPLEKKKPREHKYEGRIKKDKTYDFSIGDEARFFHKGKLMQGKIEDIKKNPNPMDEVLLFAFPVNSPTTKHHYRIALYELKPWSIWDKKHEEPEVLPTRTYLVTVKVIVEVANKNVELTLKASTSAISSNAAIESLLDTQTFEVVVPNSIGAPYKYNGTWRKLKKASSYFDVTFSIVKPTNKHY